MPDSPDVVLAVKKDGTLYLNQEKVTMENLQIAAGRGVPDGLGKEALHQERTRISNTARSSDLIDVMREAGIEIIGIITEKKTEKAL